MVYGALLGAAGGVVSGIGAQRTSDALKDANAWHRGALRDYYNREQEVGRDYRRQYQGVDQARMGRMGEMLQEYMAPTYGQQPGDTATATSALARVGAGGNPGAGMGGAGASWGRGLARRNADDAGRQTTIAGDASMLRRIGDSQGKALTDMGIADMRLGRDARSIQSREQMQRAEMARLLQQLNTQAQGRFDRASRAGDDWMAVGGMLGAGGGLLDEWSAGNRGSGYSGELGYNPDAENRGSYVTGYYAR